jgi:hypothetical protein
MVNILSGACPVYAGLPALVAPDFQWRISVRALRFDSLFRSARVVGSLFAAAGRGGFLDRLFDRFTGFSGALLNPANQFFLLAFGILEIVIRELGPLLLQLALGDVPVALDFEFIHGALFCFSFVNRRQRDGKSVPAVVPWDKATEKAGLIP